MKNEAFNALFDDKTIVPFCENDLLARDIRYKLDSLTKPPGSLGRIEEIALKIGLIQKNIQPSVDKKIHLIFASDHHICEEGVSVYPSEVTQQMVMNMLSGGAAINVFCHQQKIPCKIYDIGVDGELPTHPDLLHRKVRKGTRNFSQSKAMTREEMMQALQAGYQAVTEDFSDYDLYTFGEMGIGNTTPSTAIVSALGQFSVELVCGLGAGLADAQLPVKVKVIRQSLEKHRPDSSDGLEILQSVGGLEIAALVGAMLGAAQQRKVVVIDGIITNAAYLVAQNIQPAIIDYCFFAHQSADTLSSGVFQMVKEKPLLNLDLRLGEGTGAILATNLIQAACNMINQMATFQSANVDGQKE